MSVVLDHTIVWSRHSRAAARYVADPLELAVGPRTGLFLPVRLGNGVTLDFADVRPDTPPVEQHYAFGPVRPGARPAARHTGQTFWVAPFHTRPGRSNTGNGGRGICLQDLDGDNLEIQTVPDGAHR